MPHVKTLVLDTSVIVKPLLDESDREKVEKMIYLKENFKLSILVPDIFRYEFMNTIGRELGADTAENAYIGFTERQVSIIRFDIDLIQKALSNMGFCIQRI